MIRRGLYTTYICIYISLFHTLLICLFNDAISSSYNKASNDRMNNEFEKIWKEVPMA
jgi:hypothetical protein